MWMLTTSDMPLPSTLSAAIGSNANSSQEITEEQLKEVLANRYLVERTLGSGNCGTAMLVTDRKEKDAKNKLWVFCKIYDNCHCF